MLSNFAKMIVVTIVLGASGQAFADYPNHCSSDLFSADDLKGGVHPAPKLVHRLSTKASSDVIAKLSASVDHESATWKPCSSSSAACSGRMDSQKFQIHRVFDLSGNLVFTKGFVETSVIEWSWPTANLKHYLAQKIECSWGPTVDQSCVHSCELTNIDLNTRD